jgi:GDPmannose 4,6-dehydratase
MTRVAIITGATGQDGSYLSELLLENGYDVFCMIRRSTYPIQSSNLTSLTLENPKLRLFDADITDQSSVMRVFNEAKIFDIIEVYNLAAQSHVAISFECPTLTVDVNIVGTLNLLESIRQNNLFSKVKFYQASTSEMFGKVQEVPQTEKTPFYPRSPYGVSKVAAHWMVVNYRETYGLFACCGILFNHESPRRGANFVTQKIVKALSGPNPRLYIGNIDARRDWGHAKDYVKAMWLMLQQETPDDFVVSTGEQHSVREFIEKVCEIRGINITWSGCGLDEIGLDQHGNVIVSVSEKFYRPCEVDTLLGDCAKIKLIGWKPEFTFDGIVKNMCD